MIGKHVRGVDPVASLRRGFYFVWLIMDSELAGYYKSRITGFGGFSMGAVSYCNNPVNI